MAVKTYVRPTLRRIAREVASHAASHGLKRSETALVGAWDERTGRISLILGVIRDVDEAAWYSEILERLRESFAEAGDPQATWHVGLVIRTIKDEDQLYSGFRVTEDEEDVTELLESTLDASWPSVVPAAAKPG